MIKARLVGKEFADDTKKGELFAGTPGLPLLRYSVSKRATNKCSEERECVGAMDVKNAFLYGRARRPIFIEVPAEDPRSQLDGVLAKLVGSLYGTRDAPLIWQDCLRGQMKLLRFIESLRAPCMFYHETKDVQTIAHVDDLFEDVYRGLADAFEMKCTDAGPETGNIEVEYLGRRTAFTENARGIHRDPKHAAILLKESGMEMC